MKNISVSNDSNNVDVVVQNNEIQNRQNAGSVVLRNAKLKIVTDSNGLFEECTIDMDDGVQHSTNKKSELSTIRAIMLRTFQEKHNIKSEV